MIAIENSIFESFATDIGEDGAEKEFETKQETKENQDNVKVEVNSKNKGSYSCEFCNRPFFRKDRLERHRFTHTGIVSIVPLKPHHHMITIANETFHVLFQKQFKCKYEGCDKEYSNDSHLRRHIRTSHEMKPEIGAVVCRDPKCGQEFTNISNMHRHFKQQHYLNHYFPCTECDEHFRRKFRLKEHLIKVHSIGDHKYVCATCEKGFFNRPSYAKHIVTHQEKQRRACDNCAQTFMKWTDLVKHRREVHKIKQVGRFICDLCPRTFTWRKSLKIHMRVHQTQRTISFKCQYSGCSKQYTTKSNLKAHVRSKHEGKKFKCPYCDNELTTNQRFKQHIKIHEEHKQNQMALLLGLQKNEISYDKNKIKIVLPAPPSKIEVPTESEVSDC